MLITRDQVSPPRYFKVLISFLPRLGLREGRDSVTALFAFTTHTHGPVSQQTDGLRYLSGDHVSHWYSCDWLPHLGAWHEPAEGGHPPECGLLGSEAEGILFSSTSL